jgi:hypothetical protein
MSEAVYTQVEDAIARHLHVMVPGGGVFGPGYRYPVGIEHGNIVMRDSDCGLAKPVIVWTTDQWRTHVDESGRGLYKQVGFWSFEAADDPAANDIRLCHQSPGSAGRRLYEMRGEIERLRAAVEALAAIVQRDRVALRKMHRNPYVGTLLDDDVKAALAEYDAALALADAAMGNETERG